MKFKKLAALFLATTLSFSLVACSGNGAENTQNAGDAFKAGTYTAEVKGHNGPVTIEVTVDGTSIKEVKAVSHKESPGISDPAFNKIPTAIVDGQTLAVDTVSGCTVSSNAILQGAEEALVQAGANIEALKVKKEISKEVKEITEETDVVIAGGGIAGLTAAIEAANSGAKVILVEKTAICGGSTSRSGGKILAAGTEQQKANGIDDNAALFAEYMISKGEGQVDEEKLTYVADQSVENFEWMEENGVIFNDNIEPLHVDLKPYRGHYVLTGGGMTDGKGVEMIEPFVKKAEELGVTILLETPANELIINEEGAVTGLKCIDADGNNLTINADSVILATGGFDSNEELMDKYIPNINPVYKNSNPANTGDGLLMAEKAGAEIVAGGGAISLYLDLNAGTYEPSGLYVDATGERFMNENEFWFQRTKRVLDRKQDKIFYITDEAGYTAGFENGIKNNKIFKADSLAELAELAGIDATQLEATAARYNELCAKGVDEDFGKKAEFMKSIEKGPFYAVTMEPTISGTLGGPLTNMKSQVLNTNKEVIKGLYAAGEVANGDLFFQEYPGSGTSIQACVAFGRIAGVEAALEALNK